MFPNETSIKLTYTAGAGRFSSRPQPVRVGGARVAPPPPQSENKHFVETRPTSV